MNARHPYESARSAPLAATGGWALGLFVALTFLPFLLMAVLPPEVPFLLVLLAGSWAPNLAAFAVLAWVLREQGGVRRLVSGWGRWRVGVGWYLAACIPFGAAALVALAYRLTGGPAQPAAEPLTAGLLLVLTASAVFTGALGEELGWRGFLLPRLQRRHSAVVASLAVGAVWAVWHLPLWFLPGQPWETLPFWAFAATAVCSSFLYTWLVNGTGGSLLLASVFHFAHNLSFNLVAITGLVPDAAYLPLLAALYAVVAAFLVWRYGGGSLSPSGRRFTAQRDGSLSAEMR